jgi:hypothetical protein
VENDSYFSVDALKDVNEVRTLKYCLAHVMYCTRLSGFAPSDTRVIKGAAISSVTRSTVTAVNRSDKIAGTMHLVSQSYRDVTRA